jgi:hypothetical protein
MSSESGWTAAESPAPLPGGYDLRPLSTGEVLDRTFQLYRSRFVLFASLAALPAVVQFAGGAVQVLTMRTEQVVRNGRTITVAAHPLLPAIITLVTTLIFFMVYGITQAATTWAVAEIYLGKMASVRTAWRTAMMSWFRYIRVVLRQYWSILWPAGLAFTLLLVPAIAIPGKGFKVAMMIVAGVLLAGCFFYAVYAAIRVSLAVPAAVIESLKANAAVRRSRALLPERKFRIFLMFLLLMAISMVIAVVISPLQFLTVLSHGIERLVLQILDLTGTFLSGLLVGPIGAIALCLFYFDERVRHEGFDIEFLMRRAGGGLPANPEQPAVEGNASPEEI